MSAIPKEFHCTVYQDFKISIPVKLRKILELSPNDEIIFKINDNQQIVVETAIHELIGIQNNIQEFFKGKSIVGDFLNSKKSDYDDN